MRGPLDDAGGHRGCQAHCQGPTDEPRPNTADRRAFQCTIVGDGQPVIRADGLSMNAHRIVLCIILAVSLALFSARMAAQTDCEAGTGPLRPAPPEVLSQQQIIEKFAASESEGAAALQQYTFRQDILIQTLNYAPGFPIKVQVDGEFRMVADISYEKGKRVESVTFAPQSTLRRIILTPQDQENLRTYASFTRESLPNYNFLYAGQQRVDELDTYVFDVTPKSLEKKRSYFQGRFWVEKRDLQIVKTCGKNVVETSAGKKTKRGENVFPKFVTYREQIDGRHWFPTYIRSDDILKFNSGRDILVREIVKYTNYKRRDAQPRRIESGISPVPVTGR